MTIRKLYRLFAALCLLALGALAQSKAQQIDAFLAKYHEYGLFNGAALVAENGRVIHKAGYGLANMEWESPNAPDTRFRLGSITKQFTATLVLQLVNEGKIDLQSPMGRYLPDYPKKVADKVTVHQLLNHTSGIPSYTGLPDFFNKYSRDPYSVSDFIKVFSDLDLEFEPGSKFRYNNSGYFLLGAIIEHVSGARYEDLLRKRIFEPLGMNGSGYDHGEAIIPRRAAGYESRLDGYRNAPYLDMSLPYAAGSLYSTVEDLYLWDQALYGDRVLPAAHRELMFTPHLDNYAYGWIVRDVEKTSGTVEKAPGEKVPVEKVPVEKVTVTEHGGGINGFNTVISRIPADKHLVVLFSNAGGAPLQDMVAGIRAILYRAEARMPAQPISRLLYETYRAKGLDAALVLLAERKAADDKTVEISPREIRRFAAFLSEEKNPSGAVEVTKVGLKLFPGEWTAHFDLGEALRKAGDKPEARKSYARALEMAPESVAQMIVGRLKDLVP